MKTSTQKTINTVICAFVVALSGLLSAQQSVAQSDYCFEEAGKLYNINPTLLWAIAKVESEFNPSAISKNKNGSYDFGVMQINSFWHRTFGDETWNELGDTCTNVQAGAWILAQSIETYGYTWEAVGYYNARSKAKREKYVQKVQKALKEAYRLQKEQAREPAEQNAEQNKDESQIVAVTDAKKDGEL
jgi:soluble lytic murein transglycosylase-like protein